MQILRLLNVMFFLTLQSPKGFSVNAFYHLVQAKLLSFNPLIYYSKQVLQHLKICIFFFFLLRKHNSYQT